MQHIFRPAAGWELASHINDARRRGLSCEIMGAGTKRTMGRPLSADIQITTTGLRGIPLYEPSELVMSARAGTPLAEVERELDRNNQMLAAEPLDLGPLLGQPAGGSTIGAAFATNLSGARRVAAGSLRDQLLGVQAVNGRGEEFKSGGRVMKNVTGYDVARGLTGSWGTLAVLTEVTFKLLPKPEETQTLVIFGLEDSIAAEAMTTAMTTPQEVSAACHVPAALVSRLENPQIRGAGRALTLLRLENFSRFLPARIEKLKKALVAFGDMQVLGDESSRALWSELRRVSPMLSSDAPLWRVSVAPLDGPKVVADISRHMPVTAFYDWSGGLVWLEVPGATDAGATDIRRVVSRTTGHATLVRASPDIRASVDVFQPLDPGLARLTQGLKASFDPAGVLNRGRMYAGL